MRALALLLKRFWIHIRLWEEPIPQEQRQPKQVTQPPQPWELFTADEIDKYCEENNPNASGEVSFAAGYRDFKSLAEDAKQVMRLLSKMPKAKKPYCAVLDQSGRKDGFRDATFLARKRGLTMVDKDAWIMTKHLRGKTVDMRSSPPMNATWTSVWDSDKAQRGKQVRVEVIMVEGAHEIPFDQIAMEPDDHALPFAVISVGGFCHRKKPNYVKEVWVIMEFVDLHTDGRVTGYRYKAARGTWEKPIANDNGEPFSTINFIAAVEFGRTIQAHWICELIEPITRFRVLAPVSEGEFKQIFNGKETAQTPSGRHAPIIHWVMSHKRVNGQMVRTHLRGTNQFRKNGLDWKVYMPGAHKRVGKSVLEGYSSPFGSGDGTGKTHRPNAWRWLLDRALKDGSLDELEIDRRN